MKPTSILLTLLSSLTLATAELSYYCPMARDKTNMIQKAYCCDTLSPAPHTDLAVVSDDSSSVLRPLIWISWFERVADETDGT
ncbi:uncharacterized protein ACLA_019310 [Aspergillus clavatus NRRL 1]|uniref:Uncharacterized protein n=1 Tax=Aspergillus clavatus (strain ATCC 1007 / CBS 513.65 / DSM 816 / NCTC 3887 / NRRL 1 / QM 1276 / 107) TaxID=344612 RepID=A1CNK5_ASPCL|nr:uncharacterized protein ACLA_019310 [Aspergillus clavatus NRRL 1]EAW07226.1 hypothetical protein ACLA_019310 [Aspergillus clavatus NRRL 1]